MVLCAVKELMPNKEDVEMETNPSYMSVVPVVQVRGLERSGETKYMNVGLVD